MVALTSPFFSAHASAKAIGGRAARGRVRRDGLRHLQRLGSPFGLLHALVAASGAAVGRRRRVDRVFAAEHAARQRAVRDHAQPVVRGGWQLGWPHVFTALPVVKGVLEKRSA